MPGEWVYRFWKSLAARNENAIVMTGVAMIVYLLGVSCSGEMSFCSKKVLPNKVTTGTSIH